MPPPTDPLQQNAAQGQISTPEKVVRVGVTESAALLMLEYEGEIDLSSPWAISKLWHMWNSIWFYDRRFPLATVERDGYNFADYMTRMAREYWQAYLAASDSASILVHLVRSQLDLEEQFGRDRQMVDRIFDDLPQPPKRVESIYRYSWVESLCEGRSVIVVSPFARLMRQQTILGHLEKLRPNFRPSDLSFFEFPYCFGNTGPHDNSFQTIDWVTEQLSLKATPGTVVLLSCGSMGVIIGDRLHRQGAHTHYCGGAMQLFFGIMGGRWRSGRPDDAIDPEDKLLDSFETNPEWWIDDIPPRFIPKQAKRVENGCYW